MITTHPPTTRTGEKRASDREAQRTNTPGRQPRRNRMSAPCPNCDNPNLRQTSGMRCETCGRDFATDLGWWAISGTDLLDLLRRAHDGEDPDLVYAEAFANAQSEDVE